MGSIEDLQLIMNSTNNYFYIFKETGVYKLEKNKIQVKGTYVEGQFIRIVNSILNDGIYKIKSVDNDFIELEGETTDELMLKGCICSLRVPKEVLQLSEKIKEFRSRNTPTLLKSESFADYSYSINTDKKGNIATWESVFFSELKPYRKMFDNIGYVRRV